MKEKIIEFLSEIAKDAIMNGFGDAGKKIGEEYINKKVQSRAMEKALEGESLEMAQEQLKELAAALQTELEKPQTGFCEHELREIFDKQYEIFSGDNKEALWQRFLLYCGEYLEHLAADSSFAEQMLLKNSKTIQEGIEKSRQKVEELQMGVEAHNKKLYTPVIELDREEEVLIEPYCPELLLFGTYISLDQTPNRSEYADELQGRVYVVTLTLKNLGDTEIRHIDCTYFSISLCGEDQEGEEGAVSCLDVVEHNQKGECNVSISPRCKQKIRLVVTWDEDYDDDWRMADHNWRKRLMRMNLTVFGEEGQQKEKEFVVYMENLEESMPVGKEGFPGRYKLTDD